MTENDERNRDKMNLRQKVEAAQEKQQSAQEGFRQADNIEDIRKHLAAVPFINDEATARKALSLLQDTREPPMIRIMAVQKTTNIFINDPAFINTTLKILIDKSEDPTLRKASMDTLRKLRFGSRLLMSMNAEFRDAMRTLLDDPATILRSIAAETLALEKDEYVQRRLLEDLIKPEPAIVPRAKAIQLLGHDIHAEQFPIVRKILEEETATESEKIEAIHVLGKDPTSKDLLRNLMLDKNQDQEIRLTSASALQAAQPETFINAAKEVILNEKENKGLRVLCLNGLMQNMDHTDLKDDDDFLFRVSKIKTLSFSTELKKVSKKYVERMNLKKGTNKK